ncbi:MAG TPA: FecR domain-containing protein [Acidimicrobiia bacterium]|jgi:hypothetical protein
MSRSSRADERGGQAVATGAIRRSCLALCVVVLVIGSAGAAGAKESKKPKAAKKPAVTLATLKVLGPKVQVKSAGKSKYATAKSGRVLRQGDAIKTDGSGIAEIDYTDGSLTRLGVSTQYTLTTLTNKKGARQTKGTLSVGQTWNRAAKVAQSGSFEVEAGGATAAVEGTAFSYSCQQSPTGLLCQVVDVVDNVQVSTTAGAVTALDPATSVDLNNGVAGDVSQLTFEDLASNTFIANNVTLDFYTGKGAGFDEFPPPTTTTTVPPRRVTPTTQPPETTLPPTTTQPTLPPTTAPPPTTTTCVPSNKVTC